MHEASVMAKKNFMVDNLNQLVLAPRSKKQAQMLLKFSQDTYDAYKKTD